MKKFLVPTCLVLCLIGIFAVWYFGHQSTDPEELKSESKDGLPIENRPQDISSIPESTQNTDKGDTAGEIETSKEGSNSEKTNATGNTDANAALDEKNEQEQVPQQPLSAEDIAAAAAFEAYAKAEMEYDSAIKTAKEVLKAKPVDDQRLKSATDDLKNVRLRREETLRNLAAYSETAAEILAADETRAAAAEKEIDRITADDKKRSAEMKKQILVEGFNRLSPEQQRTLLERFPELRELLRED